MRTLDGHIPRAARVRINEEFASVEAFINEYVADLSSTGVFIKSKDPLPVGTRVALKFSIIVEDIATCTARLVANPSSYHLRRREIAPLVEKLAAWAAAR